MSNLFHINRSTGDIALDGLTANRLLSLDVSKIVTNTDLNTWVEGTVSQIAVANDGDGSITLSLTGGASDIAALTPTDGNFIVGDGANWVAESGNTARTSLGVGTGDNPTFAGVSSTASIIMDNSISLMCKDSGGTSKGIVTRWSNDEVYFDNMISGKGIIVRTGAGTNQIYITDGNILSKGNTFQVFNYGGTAGFETGPNYLRFIHPTASQHYYLDNMSIGGSIVYRVSNVSSIDTTALIISSSGNVGVGSDTTPDYRLDVQGTFRSDGVASFGSTIQAASSIRSDTLFNYNGTDGVTQASAAGTVCDVTALGGGIATAQTQITYATDGTYNFDATVGKVSSITITNGRITGITTA